MAEHILANIDFSTDQSDELIQKKLALQLSALAFYTGSKEDVAVLPYKLDPVYLETLNAIQAPIGNYILWNDLYENAVINPWCKTQKLLQECKIKKVNIKYPLSEIELKAGSKAFAFSISPPPFISTLVDTKQTAVEFLQSQQGLFVIKSPDQQSGMGHYFIQAHPNLTPSCLPDIIYKNVRLEKWVTRLLDFSSQWLLNQHVNLLGLCEIINNDKGGYKGSKYPLVKPEYDCFFKEHIKYITPIIHALHAEGYRGNLGVDAFIFEENNEIKLCPLIEINPRKTMGFVALNLAIHLQKPCHIEKTFHKHGQLLLPQKIEHENKTFSFKSNLELKFF